ncbi:hypothetical protein ACQ4PT_026688 [Festuca glaucescens]
MELTLIILSLVSLVILVSLLGGKSSKRRPPGPRRLPLIGNLLHLLTPEPQVVLRDLAKKHGPVMSLRLVQVDAVIISSPSAAQEVLRDNNVNFASRPSILASQISCYGNLDIAFSPYGEYWRMLRKLCTMELLSARKVRQFAAIRDSKTMSLVQTIRDTGKGGKPVNMGKLLMSCANTITAQATFGEGCEGELQERFLSAIQVLLDQSGGLCFTDLFPALGFLDAVNGVKSRLWRAHRQVDAVFDEIINGCEARREKKQKEAATATTGDDDLLSVMLRIMKEEELEFPIGKTNIKAITVDLFTAGTETTSATLEWIMAQLIKNPEVMAKAQAEVRLAFDNKSPEEHAGCLDQLHYTKMVIKEGLRLHPPAPLLLPRVCRETCDVGGFEVAAGSRIMVNAWAIGRSPEHWQDDPEEFKPERFNEIAAPDYNGTDYKFLPFGSGRRMCPGANFGLATLELTLPRLLYYFDWSLPAGILPAELDMEMSVSAAARRKNQLHLVATPYKTPGMEI